MGQSKQGVATLYLLQNLTFSFITHQNQLRFLSNLHNRVSFYVMIKTRGNNPILTLKPNIFLHISSTSTPPVSQAGNNCDIWLILNSRQYLQQLLAVARNNKCKQCHVIKTSQKRIFSLTLPDSTDHNSS